MDLTKSSNPNSFVLASAKIEISKSPVVIQTAAPKGYTLQELEDLGLARSVVMTPSTTKIEVQADNGTVPIKGQENNKMTVTFSLLERYIPLLGKIMEGLVTVKSEAGNEQSFTDKHPANSLSAGKLIAFAHFNYDGTSPTQIVLSQGGTELVEGDDYIISEFAGAHYFQLLAAGAFDPELALNAVYTVTPAVSYTLGRGGCGIANPLAMRLTNKRKTDDGRIISRIWEFPYGFYNGDDGITLKSKNDADNIAEVPMSFEFSPHPDMIEDADLEPWSLSREIEEV